jgi:hypothetical protein
MNEANTLESRIVSLREMLNAAMEEIAALEEKIKSSSALKTVAAVVVGAAAVVAVASYVAPVLTTIVAAKTVVSVTGMYFGLKLLGALFFGPWVLLL